MLATALWSAGSLILGLGGVWIAALFIPSVAVTLKAVLDFARSPIGQILALIALVLFVFVSAWIGGDIHGTNVTKAEWKADRLARAKAEADRTAQLNATMRSTVEAKLAADQVFSLSIDEKVKTYVPHFPANAACRATRDDIRWLFSIR